MKYANAADRYPPDLVRELQRKHTGLLWVPVGKRRRLKTADDEQRDAEIRRARAMGKSIREIAALVHLSKSRVGAILCENSRGSQEEV